MSFTGYCAVVTKASRWWRRPYSIQITLWPAWLAQRLCPHQSKTRFGGDIWRCDDCFKFNFPQDAAVDLNDGGTGDPK